MRPGLARAPAVLAEEAGNDIGNNHAITVRLRQPAEPSRRLACRVYAAGGRPRLVRWT